MLRYTIKRILWLIPLLVVASLLVYVLMSYAGDPVYTVMGEGASQAELAAMREKMGLNQPILLRYLRYMAGLLRGDLGQTLYGESVWGMFALKFPYTLRLAVASMGIIVVVAIPLGVLAAAKQNTWVDTSLSVVTMAGMSIPDFWLGLLLILLLSVKLGWLPTSGAEGWKSIIMPAICCAMQNTAYITRMTRSSMVDQIRADYLRTARAKGSSERTVVWRHALKNALIPILTTLGSTFSTLVGGTVIIESVFAWPGVGAYFVNAVRSGDYMVVTSFTILLTGLVAVILLLVDILYALVDPRIKAQYTYSTRRKKGGHRHAA